MYVNVCRWSTYLNIPFKKSNQKSIFTSNYITTIHQPPKDPIIPWITCLSEFDLHRIIRCSDRQKSPAPHGAFSKEHRDGGNGSVAPGPWDRCLNVTWNPWHHCKMLLMWDLIAGSFLQNLCYLIIFDQQEQVIMYYIIAGNRSTKDSWSDSSAG